MSMQRPDTFTYKGEPAYAIAISQRFTFTPADNLGIETAGWATSNHRGFWCDYSIDEVLTIQNLYLFSHDHQYPLINGRQAEKIPEFVRLILEVNANSRTPKRYDDGFPMQYMGIDYDVDYTGRIALGVKPSTNKSGERRYRRVYDLLFESGILLESTDITELWRSTVGGEQTCSDYWWQQEENDYYYLINYRFMGLHGGLE